MTQQQTKTRFPAPLYAAAGAGDLAYQQLRKLPAVVSELGDRAVASLKVANETATTTASTLRATDLDALRGTAAHGAVALAQAAQERALAVYTALVAHGERVVGTGVLEAADVVNSDIETTEDPAAADIDGPKAVAAATSKPRKRTTRSTVK